MCLEGKGKGENNRITTESQKITNYFLTKNFYGLCMQVKWPPLKLRFFK